MYNIIEVLQQRACTYTVEMAVRVVTNVTEQAEAALHSQADGQFKRWTSLANIIDLNNLFHTVPFTVSSCRSTGSLKMSAISMVLPDVVIVLRLSLNHIP